MDARVVSKAILPHRTGSKGPESGYFQYVTSSIFSGANSRFAGRTLAEKPVHLRGYDENSRAIRGEADDGVSIWLSTLNWRSGRKGWSRAGSCFDLARQDNAHERLVQPMTRRPSWEARKKHGYA